LAAALLAVVRDDVGGGVVVGACAVTKCVAPGVTGVASTKESAVITNVPAEASASLAAAIMSDVGDDIAGCVVVGAHVSPVDTDAPPAASLSLTAAVLSVVDNIVAIATATAFAAGSASFV